jgi:hypothetical protein
MRPADQWINSSLVKARGLNVLAFHATGVNTAASGVDVGIDQILEEARKLLDVLPPLPDFQSNIPQVEGAGFDEGNESTGPPSPPSCKLFDFTYSCYLTNLYVNH